VALPPGIDISTANSLGLRLVDALVSSIDGHVFVERTNGTKISMTFPARLVNER
jgi:two-component sensor histidine kinase